MPYKSLKQARYLHSQMPELAKEWDKETNFSDLVEKKSKEKKKTRGK